MKFLADMGISTRTVAWLQAQGHDALHLRDEGMQRADDTEILTKARAEDRVVLTVDLDFGYLLAISGAVLPSVILFRLGDERAEIINTRLQTVLSECADALNEGAIVSVTSHSFRVRKLPI